MEVNKIRSLLNEINHFNYIAHGTKPIEDTELILLDYLKQNPTDLDMWYNLVLLNLIFLHDETSAIKYLGNIRERFNDEKATILICFLHDSYFGGVEEADYKMLQAEEPVDSKMKACKEYYLAMYYKEHQKDIDYAKLLAKSIIFYENFVHAYIELGYFFHDEKMDQKTAQLYFSKALSSVEKIFTESDIKKANYFDLNAYFDQMIFSTSCTIPKYEYIQSLANGTFGYM